MISRTAGCTFFIFCLLLVGSSRFFYFRFSLKSSNEYGVSPFSWHFLKYFCSSYFSVCFFFYMASSLALCLVRRPSSIYLFLRTSSTKRVSLPPSSLFAFFSIIFSCFLLTNCKSFIYYLSFLI